MIKKYIKTGSMLRRLAIRVIVDGKEILVEFGGGGHTLASFNCFFITSDKVLQAALEKHKDFNKPNGFKIEFEQKEESDESPDPAGESPAGDKKAPAKTKAVNTVTDLDGAKKYILENYKGYTLADVETLDKVKELAVKLGISFSKLVG